MSKCINCRHLYCDASVGYYECMQADKMNDIEYDQYERLGYVTKCPYFEQQQDIEYPCEWGDVKDGTKCNNTENNVGEKNNEIAD